MADLKLKKAYETVFNKDGTMKVCGREACKNLIEACQTIDPETYFGDMETGMICLDNFEQIKKLCLGEK